MLYPPWIIFSLHLTLPRPRPAATGQRVWEMWETAAMVVTATPRNVACTWGRRPRTSVAPHASRRAPGAASYGPLGPLAQGAAIGRRTPLSTTRRVTQTRMPLFALALRPPTLSLMLIPTLPLALFLDLIPPIKPLQKFLTTCHP